MILPGLGGLWQPIVTIVGILINQPIQLDGIGVFFMVQIVRVLLTLIPRLEEEKIHVFLVPLVWTRCPYFAMCFAWATFTFSLPHASIYNSPISTRFCTFGVRRSMSWIQVAPSFGFRRPGLDGWIIESGGLGVPKWRFREGSGQEPCSPTYI